MMKHILGTKRVTSRDLSRSRSRDVKVIDIDSCSLREVASLCKIWCKSDNPSSSYSNGSWFLTTRVTDKQLHYGHHNTRYQQNVFFYCLELTTSQCLLNIFWPDGPECLADGRSVAARPCTAVGRAGGGSDAEGGVPLPQRGCGDLTSGKIVTFLMPVRAL